MEIDDVLLNQPVVFDNGSGTIKAGIAGEEQPRVYFSSFVGRPKHTKVMAGALEGDTFIGQEAQNHRGLLKLKYPCEHGIVTDWDDMERIWNHVYNEELKILPEEHPVLLTEPPLNPWTNRERIAQVFFETFNVPALYISLQAILSLYASGMTTGVVLDAGDGVTHCVPVYGGYAITPAIQRVDIAGRDVTNQLQLLLRRAGTDLSTSAEKEIVRNIKEKVCYVSSDPEKEQKEWLNGLDQGEIYRLPDGKDLRLGTERFKAPEILFTPSIIGSEEKGVHTLLADSIARVDLELRPKLYETIYLSGGTTLTRGFPDRLLAELKLLAMKNTKIKIHAPTDRKYSTWVGGSILASLSTFKKMWLSVDDWHENPDAIHRCV